ncbi:hypothetical protein LA066_004710 [Vibrio parahaemolyticus]|nr:hypothetical protein [Vibrio parahaemolyticus]
MIAEQQQLRQLISTLNDSLDELLVSENTLIRYDKSKCKGGHYADYRRAVYKAESVDEYEQLKAKYHDLDLEYLALLEAIADSETTPIKPTITSYKNNPIFLGDNVTNLTLATATAYRSVNRKSPEQTKRNIEINRWFYRDITNLDNFDDILVETKREMSRKAASISDRTGGKIKPVLDDDGDTITLTISPEELFQYASELEGVEFSSITFRRESGKKYTARIIRRGEPSEKLKFGMYIIHPNAPITEDDIIHLQQRPPSQNSLSNRAVQLKEIAGEAIVSDVEIWLVK